MSDELKLHHNLIEVPTNKKASDVVAERHDMVLLFDATKANPNGDPDMSNMPRRQPDTLKGLVTDVCLKRKIRNFLGLYNVDGSPIDESAGPRTGCAIFIRENAVLQQVMESPEIEKMAKELFAAKYKQKPDAWNAKKKSKSKKAKDVETPAEVESAEKPDANGADEFKKRSYRDALCATYFDLRAFGGVVSTEGPLKGSFYGQIRGPLQFAFAESLDRTLQLDATITRCAVASEKEKPSGDESDSGDHRTMGRKHVVDYGLYRTHIYFSPAFAAKTGFTYYDLDNFIFALTKMYVDDPAAGRTGMRIVGLVDFKHSAALGDEHSHKLFADVIVKMKPAAGDYPHSLDDYEGTAPGEADKYVCVRSVKENGQTRERVWAKRIVWEIPAPKSTEDKPNG